MKTAYLFFSALHRGPEPPIFTPVGVIDNSVLFFPWVLASSFPAGDPPLSKIHVL